MYSFQGGRSRAVGVGGGGGGGAVGRGGHDRWGWLATDFTGDDVKLK